MLNELVEFGRRIRKADASDALKQEDVVTDLLIDSQGNFLGFTVHDKIPTLAEALTAKKGKARLLVDKPEETLGLDAKKHAWYLAKLQEYADVLSLAPVLLFYGENKAAGLKKAVEAFETSVPQKERTGNIAFLLPGDSVRLHEKPDVTEAIVRRFEGAQKKNKGAQPRACSVCGTTDYPVLADPHGMIKNVPDGQTSGSALISYNEKAFESYGLASNENSSVCTACARNYVEGLTFLLNNGERVHPEKGKPYYRYSHRKNLSPDTAMIYWTRSGAPSAEIQLVDNPEEHWGDIASMLMEKENDSPQNEAALELLLNAPYRGAVKPLETVDADRFYACILSGAAARIAIRSWIESTTSIIKANVTAWFHDIAIVERNFDTDTPEMRFFPLRSLANACGVHRKKETGGAARFELDSKDDFPGRAATMLWNCALLGRIPPWTLLDRVLRRIRMEEGRVTAARAALVKFILNKNIQIQKIGGKRMRPKLDMENVETAHMAGRIFAVLESIQTAALGKDLNAPIRDRFYSAASTTPAPAFGRLIKMSQNHLSKLRGEKPGLAVTLDKQLGELFASVRAFPSIFSLEEQGQFAIGYYHQRQENFSKPSTNSEKE